MRDWFVREMIEATAITPLLSSVSGRVFGRGGEVLGWVRERPPQKSVSACLSRFASARVAAIWVSLSLGFLGVSG